MESDACIWAPVFLSALKKTQNDGNTFTKKIQAEKKIMAMEH